jgi:hypothetical protein
LIYENVFAGSVCRWSPYPNGWGDRDSHEFRNGDAPGVHHGKAKYPASSEAGHGPIDGHQTRFRSSGSVVSKTKTNLYD